MGMAASQARFLGITARKTNTEYEGQQVNQQRTALANQSANLFNQLLGLDLPVPPNKNDSKYTKTVYAFIDDSAQKATIETIVNNTDKATNVEWPKIVRYTTQVDKQVAYRNNLNTTGQFYLHDNLDGTHTSWINTGNGQQAELIQINVNDFLIKSKIRSNLITEGLTEEAAEKETSNLYKYDNNYLNVPSDTKWSASVLAKGAQNESSLVKRNGNYFIIPSGSSEEKALTSVSAEEITTNSLGDGNWYKYNDGTKDWFYNLDNVSWTADVNQYNKDGQKISDLSVTNIGSRYQVDGTLINPVITSTGDVSDVDKAMIEEIKKQYSATSNDNTFYRYIINNQAYYIPESQTLGKYNTDTFALNKISPTNPDNYPFGYWVKDENVPETKEYKARTTYDSSGRLQSIQLDNGTNDAYAISVNSVTDEKKYEDAMNQYKYDMAKYEKTVEDINAQTEKIQVQDRTLELRLKQLDTEQEALTQEMDAIKKVIDKNVETTFKTFA